MKIDNRTLQDFCRMPRDHRATTLRKVDDAIGQMVAHRTELVQTHKALCEREKQAALEAKANQP